MSCTDPGVADPAAAATPAAATAASGLKGAARGSSVWEGVRSRKLELTGEKFRPAGPVRPRSGLLIQPGKEEAHDSSAAEASALPSATAADAAAPTSVRSSAQSSESVAGGCGLSGTSDLASVGKTSGGGALTQGEESNDGGRSAWRQQERRELIIDIWISMAKEKKCKIPKYVVIYTFLIESMANLDHLKYKTYWVSLHTFV